MDSPIRIGVDGKVSLAGVGLDIAFIEVTEDSRCPTSVACIWAGQATVLIGLVYTGTGEDLGEGHLTIGAGDSTSASQTFGPYRAEILELDPYPEVPATSGREAEYTATLLVTEEDVTKSGSRSLRGQPLTALLVAGIVGGRTTARISTARGPSGSLGTARAWCPVRPHRVLVTTPLRLFKLLLG